MYKDSILIHHFTLNEQCLLEYINKVLLKNCAKNTDNSSHIKVSEWNYMTDCAVLFASCVVQSRHVLTFLLTVKANAGAASFLRFSQAPKKACLIGFVWHMVHISTNPITLGVTLGQTIEVWAFYCGCIRYLHTLKKKKTSAFAGKETSSSGESNNQKKWLSA